MSGPDEVIHQSMRLKITATLNALPRSEQLEFNKLKSVLGATDGNLSTHLNALEKAGYVEIAKDFVGKKPRTRVALTKQGRRAFTQHVAYLKSLLDV